MNVFYISYIYKPATSSHTKPGVFETTSLTLLLTDSWIPPFRKSLCAVTSELDLRQISNFADSWLRVFASSRLRSFAGSRFQISARSRLLSFAGSRFPIFASLRLLSFAGSRFPIFASSMFLKTHFTNFINLDVSRVTGFPEFPNTSPSGKRVDSDDPIPRKSWNFSKKRHPWNVGGDTRPPEISQWSNRGVFAELPPSPL
jgi:hypothetical protein